MRGPNFPIRYVLTTLLCIVASVAQAERLSIAGADARFEANIRAFTELDDEPCTAPRWRIRHRFEQLEQQAARALEPYGYYDSELSSSLAFASDCWEATLNVVLGEPVRLREVDLRLSGEATSDDRMTEIFQRATLKRGDIFEHSRYAALKRRVAATASERGYFRGEWETARADVWPPQGAADISLTYLSGPRFRFGDIEIEQSILDDDVVRRYVRMSSGEPYSSTALAHLQRDLSASGYFRLVDPRPEINTDGAPVVPVKVALEPAKRTSYSVGAGFSTDTGPRFRSGYENRRINKRGHQLSGNLLYSTVLSELTTTYRRPLGDPTVEWLSYSVGLQTEDTETSDTEAASLGVKRVSRLSNDWLRTEGLTLKFDRFRVGDIVDTSQLLMPSVGFSKKRSNSDTYPTRGYSLAFQVRGADEALASSTSFLQVIAGLKYIRSLTPKTRLLLRADAGSTIKKEFNELPPSVRFFAGGTESVRGFGYETLGPKDDDGLVIGGSHLLSASAEVDRRFAGSFAYAIFVDAGNAFDGTNTEARISAGLGLKWLSPIGPLRLYLAKPVNFNDKSVRIHFSIGPDL